MEERTPFPEPYTLWRNGRPRRNRRRCMVALLQFRSAGPIRRTRPKVLRMISPLVAPRLAPASQRNVRPNHRGVTVLVRVSSCLVAKGSTLRVSYTFNPRLTMLCNANSHPKCYPCPRSILLPMSPVDPSSWAAGYLSTSIFEDETIFSNSKRTW